MNRLIPSAALIALTALSACGRLGLADGPAYDAPPPPQAPAAAYPPGQQVLPPPPGGAMMAPAPGGTVTAQPLPPPGGTMAPGAMPAAPPAVAVAPDKALPVTKGGMSGGWVLTSGIDSCQLFLTQTAWAGGSRANAKGCTAPELQKIASWTLDGKQVTLKGSDGSTVATLYSGAPEQFSGMTGSRQPITLSR